VLGSRFSALASSTYRSGWDYIVTGVLCPARVRADFLSCRTCGIIIGMTAQSADQPSAPFDIADVRKALTCSLPGLSAQLGMAPGYPTAALMDRTPPPEPKEAGVLVLFYPHDDQLYFPLTQRTDTVESHKGQVSLPGGAREGHESLTDTALRETCEELGACADNWTLLGQLTPLYISASGFRINPFVAYSPARPDFKPDPVEVAELIETPLSLLLDPATVRRQEWQLRGSAVEVPYYHICGHKVWGATAMVLSELVTLLRGGS
jgi:8-oxo-dGTP pyrophosphatase MutT (NUDIX family)